MQVSTFSMLLLFVASVSEISAFVHPVSSPFSSKINKANPVTVTFASGTPTLDNVDDVVSIEVEASKENDEKFDWFKSWYPVVPVEILDPEKPHKFQLLGMDLVVWNDAPMEGEHGLFRSKKDRPKNAKRSMDGQWRVFVDECPHRKVPLSEGRIEDDGSLFCSYHGWRFDGEGDLKDIPQLDSTDSLDTIKQNPKSKCNAFPAQIVDGLLWVWPETGDDARLESALTEVPAARTDQTIDEDKLWVGTYNFRELPYGADYFIENVVDPAHVSISHHNVVGNRYNAQHMHMETDTQLTKDGFRVKVTGPMNPNPSYTEFKAPCLVITGGEIGNDGSKQLLELYASPSRPGFCNHMGRMVIQKSKDGKIQGALKQFTLPLPKWLNHVMAASFLNQDGLFLHHQERTLSKTGQYASHAAGQNDDDEPMNYNKVVLHINADKGVINFRNWLRILAGGSIPYKNNPSMPPADNDVVFDQWNGHTKHCQYCLAALKNLRKARFASFFVSACIAVLRPAKMKLVNLAATFVTAGLGLLLGKLIGLFYKFEFSHAHND